jgi:hypothetical protein
VSDSAQRKESTAAEVKRGAMTVNGVVSVENEIKVTSEEAL